MALSIFDLDNTLIAGDSDHSWGQFMVARGLVDKHHYSQQNDYFYQQYQQSALDIDAYLEFALAPLAAHDPGKLTSLRDEFLDLCIGPLLLPKARALLQQHRDQGRRLLIITSTNSFVAAPICELLGVNDYITSEAEIVAGRYTGKPAAVPAYKEGKTTLLKQWLEVNNMDLQDSYGYSDSINDLPLLEAVEHPVCVDADDALRAHAAEHDWPCISLRD